MWKPTLELRYWVRYVPEGSYGAESLNQLLQPKLQQKWIEVGYFHESGGYSGQATAIERETGEFQWRDVPTVTEGA